jgi:MFS family permease
VKAETAMTARLGESVGLLRDRSLRLLFLARAISVLGDMLTPVALAFAVLSIDGTASGLGVVLAARALPSVLLVLLGGAVGDRYPRRTVMVWSNTVGFVTQSLTGLLILTGDASIWSVALLVAVRGAMGAFFNPASTGAIVEVAREGHQQQTFAMFSVVGNIAEIAGPVLAGVLLFVWSPGVVLLLDGLTFLVAAVLIVMTRSLGTGVPAQRRSLLAEVRSGLRYVRGQRWLTVLIASASVFQLCLLSSLNVLGPLVATRSLGGASAWAAIVAGLGTGGVVGSVLAMSVRTRRPLLVGYATLVLGAGPTLLLLAIPASVIVLVVSEFVSGVVIAYFGALEASSIAQSVPRAMLSRVDSVNRFGSMVLRPVGMAMIGPIAAVVGLGQTLVIAGLLTLAAVIWPLTVREVRDLGAQVEPTAAGQKA